MISFLKSPNRKSFKNIAQKMRSIRTHFHLLSDRTN